LRAFKKSLIVFFTCMLLGAIWPIQQMQAAKITKFFIYDYDGYSSIETDFLIAGKTYVADITSDKASSTSQKLKFEYSYDDGATWKLVPFIAYTIFYRFSMPFDPQFNSVKFRMSVTFDPVIGAKSISEKIIGPYPILRLDEITDFITNPNLDGTVTLKWNDNTNMESYYEITRDGPDGTKIFTVNNTMTHMGPLTYVDKQTDTSKNTYYIYKVRPVIDKYFVKENEQPGAVWSFVKTKRLSIVGPIGELPNIPIVTPPTDPSTPVIPVGSIFKNLPNIDLKVGDLDKQPITSITLDKTYMSLKLNEIVTLSATIAPADAANKNVKWESDDPLVALVDSNGKVTGRSPGFARISVTTEMGHFKAVCIVMVGSGNEPNTPGTPVALTDIDGHPLRPDILEAVAGSIVFGYPDLTFRPNGSVTRAEFASMLMRAVKPVDDGVPLTFKDKDEIEDWALKSIQQAVKLKVIFGYDDNTFRPNANISHAEMISMVIRASGLAGSNAAKTKFSDDADIPSWARAAITKAEEVGIIHADGLLVGKLDPDAKSTRAESAAAIVRMLKVK